MEKENTLNRVMKDYSKQTEIVELVLICMVSFLVPTFLANLLKEVFGANSVIASNSQIIVGSIVNTALIITAINVKGWKNIVGVITMPSISTILSGYVFKTASPYMAYMIPVIWFGNFAIVYLYKKLLLERKMNYFLTGIVSIAVKVGIIFGGFSILNLFGVFPGKLIQNLQNAMGITQAITAFIGMIISYTVFLQNNKSLKNNK